jgi:hypothetical protein
MSVHIQEFKFIKAYQHQFGGWYKTVYLYQSKENAYLHVCGKLAMLSSSMQPPF